jgi:uncharacterized protein (DUF433 family)
MSNVDAVISAFSAEHVTSITGLSERQLSYWDATGFFKPQFKSFGEGRAAVRVYSFRDVVSLRTLRLLRVKHKVSLQHLRIVASNLSKYTDSPFSKLRLAVCNKEVYFHDSATNALRGVVTGQYAFVAIIDVIGEVKRAAADLTKRRSANFGKLEQHRNIAHNSLVISGTRIPVRTVEHFIEDGFTTAEILQEYPTLTEADIRAVSNGVKNQAAA